MDYLMTVYESEECRSKDPEDRERFDRSYEALRAAGIGIRRVECSGTDDVAFDDARQILDEQGMAALPITEYQDVMIESGRYPTDQDLADFLDAPDGTLSVNKQGPPAMGNDIMPACACGNKTR